MAYVERFSMLALVAFFLIRANPVSSQPKITTSNGNLNMILDADSEVTIYHRDGPSVTKAFGLVEAHLSTDTAIQSLRSTIESIRVGAATDLNVASRATAAVLSTAAARHTAQLDNVATSILALRAELSSRLNTSLSSTVSNTEVDDIFHAKLAVH